MDNVLKLPEMMSGDEVKELLDWIDQLTLAELKEAKELYERHKNEEAPNL